VNSYVTEIESIPLAAPMAGGIFILYSYLITLYDLSPGITA
jgi:hypothetical protein